MKPHKHAELIKAWADGAEIEQRSYYAPNDIWHQFNGTWWNDDSYWEYRIKPEPKEDLQYLVQAKVEDGKYLVMNHDIPRNLRIIFDGETGELKSAEVLK